MPVRRNDLLFSLLVVSQGVIDVSGELLDRLERLPGFRNVLIHDYVELEDERVPQATRELEPVAEFIRIVADLELDEAGQPVSGRPVLRPERADPGTERSVAGRARGYVSSSGDREDRRISCCSAPPRRPPGLEHT